jgi:tRNA(Ile2) C34 agmatinyltransferase TiaS
MSKITCPACDSVQPKSAALLGSLGRMTYYRCRHCGMDFSKTKRPRDVFGRAITRTQRIHGTNAR